MTFADGTLFLPRAYAELLDRWEQVEEAWPTSCSTATPWALSTGPSCAWTPRPCGLTSMLPGPEKRALAG
ncbi:hypothetical protein GCM10010304_81680 [Streptomyces roseoviolaceus]